ncbi:thioredoxin-like protein [Striga asiatica]|uniref:Thioredoxin-like protein n=1 Tax=Striga asiatica TaxID=4170 RepID=A0A5A7NZL6_STRAF|nr:thioredoxin-like protein [Striga asiatica]
MSIISPNSHILYREVHHKELHHQLWSFGSGPIWAKPNGFGFDRSKIYEWRKRGNRDLRASAFWPELSKPSALEMESIQDCQHFDQILDKAKELSQPILVDWMAAWCRKCIYLKPKLEKLATEYDTKLKFYCVDVNNVPKALVKRGNISVHECILLMDSIVLLISYSLILISEMLFRMLRPLIIGFHRVSLKKMPTIQIWKDGEMKAEVIGGHKAWLVIDEVRAMIQQFV